MKKLFSRRRSPFVCGAVALVWVMMLSACQTIHPLIEATIEGRKDAVTAYLNGKPKPDRDTISAALGEAARNNNTDLMMLLISSGADVNHVNSDNDAVLVAAAIGGRVEAARLLLDKGAEVNHVNNYGDSAIDYAIKWNGSTEMLRLLLERGANLDAALATAEASSTQYNNPKSGKSLLFLKSIKAEREKARVQPVLQMAAKVPSVFKSDIDEVPISKAQPNENAYAVVIGIENYRSLPKSDYSRKDATLVKAYLRALGYEERNIELLEDEKAARTDIEKSIEAWLPNRVKKGSTVMVYFSGHGSPDPSTGDAYIVPYDGDPNYLSITGYPLKRLYEKLGRLEAGQIIVVLDSCFSGAGGRSVLAKGARPLVMQKEISVLPSRLAVMTGSQGSQISTSSPEKGHGVFTYYFLKSLKEGKKSLVEIYEYVRPKVEDEAKLLNVQQSPNLNPAPEKLAGRFILRK